MTRERIDLDIDRPNELTFKVVIEGDIAAGSKPLIRMVCESSDVTYSFTGRPTGRDAVAVTAPVMQGRLEEGTYKSYLEIIVDGRRFVPLDFDVRFGKSKRVTGVVAEVVSLSEPQERARRLTLREMYDL